MFLAAVRDDKDHGSYMFIFDGHAQVLDHILVNPALLDYFQAVDVHFNTNTPTLPKLEDDTTSPLRASNHDPVEGCFQIK